MSDLDLPEEEKEELGLLNILVLLLSFYVLFALLVSTFFKISPEIMKILNYIDHGICVVFFLDFIVRFRRAKSKWKFMRWGWIDLIASIPSLNITRAGRLFRLIRIIRILRAFRSVSQLIQHIFRNRIQGTLTTVILIAVLMLLFSSIAILQFETSPDSNIRTAEDAVWWSYVTITTVGYGDKYPVTSEGRIIAAILMTVGVGLFGTFTAFVSSWFVAGENKREKEAEEARSGRGNNF